MSRGMGSESSMEEEGGYSHKRMFVGICGVLPSIAWTAVLVFMLFNNEENECTSPRRLEASTVVEGPVPMELWTAPTVVTAAPPTSPPSWTGTGYAYPPAVPAAPASVATAAPAFVTYTPSPPLSTACDPSQQAHGGHVKRFMKFSIAGFAILVLIEILEGCVAGEHDFNVSSVECCINLATLIVFIAIYIINYYGVIQLYTATNCQGTLLRDGWLVLLGNNLVWFLTLATMIATAFCGQAIAGADWFLGDRL